jgi:sugar (pentulose or hexulose) kinase
MSLYVPAQVIMRQRQLAAEPSSNMCNISLGTSGTIFITSDEMKVDSQNALHSFAHANGKYHLMGCILSGASCNAWWMDHILRSKTIRSAGRDQRRKAWA